MTARAAKTSGWERRKARVRKKIKGTPERPRLNVFRSNKHIYAQIIEDTEGRVLCAASTVSKEIRDSISGLKKAEAAKKVGELIGERAVKKGIDKVVFDRSGHIYHGRIKALAEGARSAGLKF